MCNVVIYWKLKTTKLWQLMLIDGESCEFSIFVMSCSFASYELAKVFMNDDI
jgi:hypothetical protein